MEGTLNLVGFGLAAIGPGIATGLIFAAYINGVAHVSQKHVASYSQSRSSDSPLLKLSLSSVSFSHSFSNRRI